MSANEDVKGKTNQIALLEDVETKITDVFEIAAGVVEELGKFGETNERAVLDLCGKLMNDAKAIQLQMQLAIESRVECKPFEYNDIEAKMECELAMQKVEVVQSRLKRMKNMLNDDSLAFR
mmetsp:Transcript_29893/g.41370  ORF Transcript_29893/g.41370 Transcript_29893/m.41370 type:complete len:121 (-) Transcript_29893:90-452(-)|eukprot:CAMPEP_0196584874 /NCGR_PEP_ID=MMETSP1081-20130531/48809_1 /TAXON_ID=36882 /ORGANISM="Pyramimonas amylifera, Strain CCMP720" /LENGTH=120 /DNA_ID=CAMNT_0041906239 /DNA_START=163 /DNA_END=525 /DNA_ORIENTATION=+